MPEQTTEERFREKLAEWGITTQPRLGNYDYIVATNLFIIEELQKLNGLMRNRFPKKKNSKDVSMLDY